MYIVYTFVFMSNKIVSYLILSIFIYLGYWISDIKYINIIFILPCISVFQNVMPEHSQNDEGTTNVLFAVAVSVGSIITLVVIVFVCLCCSWFYRTEDDSDDEDSEADFSPYNDTTSTGRDDLKTLRHHSWRERVKAPFLARKTVRFVHLVCLWWGGVI